MINRELERINESTLGDFLCTLKLARFLGIAYNKTNTREGASGKLGDLVRLFGLNVKPDHRALSDTDALASIFWKMKEIYPNEVNEFIDYHQNVTASHLKQRGSTPISAQYQKNLTKVMNMK
jgi:DNA polymerase III alpha subunit (gram-positive type)